MAPLSSIDTTWWAATIQINSGGAKSNAINQNLHCIWYVLGSINQYTAGTSTNIERTN